MHDGRFDTLEKVIDHYSKGVKPHPNLDIKLRQLNAAPPAALASGTEVAPRHFNFTDSEKAALIAFLKTLTDHKFVSDAKFSDPFQ